MHGLPTLRRHHRRGAFAGETPLDDLRYIRRTMEQASSLTTFPGWGQVAIGVTALVAVPLAGGTASPGRWLAVWVAEAVLAVTLGAGAMVLKARAGGMPLVTAVWRRFALAFSLPIAAGALLTVLLVRQGWLQPLPGMWMLLYGVAIAAGGAFSVAPVRVMGYAFVVAGATALFAPPGWSSLLLAGGFGGLHIVFGAWIARHHGG